MDIHDFNPSRRRFLTGMLAVGAASALAPNPLISKVWAAGENPEQWIQSGSHYGALTITPSEASIIACDIATKSGAVEIGFLDRFTGAVVLTGDVSAVEYALKQVTRTLGEMMRFTACPITRT